MPGRSEQASRRIWSSWPVAINSSCSAQHVRHMSVLEQWATKPWSSSTQRDPPEELPKASTGMDWAIAGNHDKTVRVVLIISSSLRQTSKTNSSRLRDHASSMLVQCAAPFQGIDHRLGPGCGLTYILWTTHTATYHSPANWHVKCIVFPSTRHDLRRWSSCRPCTD